MVKKTQSVLSHSIRTSPVTTARLRGHFLRFVTSRRDRQSSSEVLPVSADSRFLFSEHMPLFWKTVHFRTTGNSAAEDNQQMCTGNPRS